MKYGLVDADLLTRGTAMPNLALMKMSGYLKEQGHEVIFLDKYEKVDKCLCSKVFDFNLDPDFVYRLDNEKVEVKRGGTGYGLWGQEPLPYEIEHHMPDYHLYDKFWETHDWHSTGHRKSNNALEMYTHFSVGFTTRGCIRHCPFCVNRDSPGVSKWSPVKEFLDPSRPKICLLDDNILAYPKWRDVFEELAESEKRFTYKQGMDIRLMTEEKAKVLNKAKYEGSMAFAFDNIKDKDIITKGFKLFRKHCTKSTMAYVLTGFYDHTINDFIALVERVNTLKSFDVKPYVMIHKDYCKNPYCEVLNEVRNFCNFYPVFMKKTFDEYMQDKGFRTKELYRRMKFKELEELTGKQ